MNMKRAVVVTWLVFVMCCGSARAQFQGIHGASNDAYVKWFERIKGDGLRPVLVSGCDAGGKVQFAAVAIKDDGKAPWEARHGLSGEQYQKSFDELSGKGFRLTWVDCYLDGKYLRYAAIWVKDGTKEKWAAQHDMTAAQYQDAVTAQQKKGLRPAQVSVCTDGKGEPRFAAVFVEEGKTTWVAKHDVPSDQFQKVFDEEVSNG